MKDDSPEQPSLWNPGQSQPFVAEAALLHFAEEYREGWRTVTSHSHSPRCMDENSFACLMICKEHPHICSQTVCDALLDCRYAAGEGSRNNWLDTLAWDVALEILGETSMNPTVGMPSIIANLTHGTSGIRMFMYELAWFVRQELPKDEVVPHLLENVSNTILYWWEALGLCSCLYEDEEEFWRIADAYQPEPEWNDQYRRNLTDIRNRNLAVTRYPFVDLDAKIRRKVMDFAMTQRCDGLGGHE